MEDAALPWEEEEEEEGMEVESILTSAGRVGLPARGGMEREVRSVGPAAKGEMLSNEREEPEPEQGATLLERKECLGDLGEKR